MKALIILFLICTITPSVFAQSATVTWTRTYQTMDGFGGHTWDAAYNLTDAQADMFFSPTAGIGLEYVRTNNTADGSIPDLVTLRKAVARGAKVELSLQSPPASMKDNGSFNNGGSLLTSQYGAYAAYIVNYINVFAAQGVPIDVVSVQNEPNISYSSLGACLWTAAQFQTFVRDNLGPAFAANGITAKIMIGEESDWFNSDLTAATLNDSAAVGYVSIVAGHGYGLGGVDGTNNLYCCHDATAYPLAITKGKHIWQSEVNGGLIVSGGNWTFDPSIADAMVWAHNIHDYLTVANVSGWQYWDLVTCCGNFNFGLTDQSFNPAKRFYAVGNWSKFVRPGWVRIDAAANPQSGVYISAFKDPVSAAFAIVAVNQNSTGVGMDFSLSGFPSVTSVTPTLTSATVDLADQTNTNVTGGAFSYSLPGMSVVTFHGVASSSSSQAPSPPTNLVVTVH